MKKIIKCILVILLSLFMLFVCTIIIFVYTAPQIGHKPEGEDLERIKQSPNYRNNRFVNIIETKMVSFSDMVATLPDFFFTKNGSPDRLLPVKFGENNAEPIDSLCFVTWYGHSAFLIEIEGKRILIDPMLGESASPVSFTTNRFSYEKPIPIEELSNIDALILSHDHYDHLDYETIIKLKDDVKHFYTALGVGSHLKHWEIPEENITELDWWQSAKFDGIILYATPARHFSGRGFNDRNATEWASWVVKGKYQTLFFSGDGGYGPHFKEIGEKYGPFDLAMMECGQYNEAWKAIHMMPEESVQAGIDLNATLLIPIHWGAFKLSVHEWTEPIIRFKAACKNKKIPLIYPYIGQRFCLGQEYPREPWWLLK